MGELGSLERSSVVTVGNRRAGTTFADTGSGHEEPNDTPQSGMPMSCEPTGSVLPTSHFWAIVGHIIMKGQG